MARPAPPPARDPLFGCLLWQGQLDRDGYAVAGRGPRAHLIAYRLDGRAIPDGWVVDHWCRRRHCVEPAHLEAVSRSENEFRKRGQFRARLRACPRGHVLARLGAAITPEGGRCCRVCTRELLVNDRPR